MRALLAMLAAVGLAAGLGAATHSGCEALAKMPAPASVAQACALWQGTERCIRDGCVGRAQARRQFKAALKALRACADWPGQEGRWAFPLPGYSDTDFQDISFQPKGFDFYAGTLRGAPHPAVDIFVHDRGQQCLDDRTGQPIAAVAPFSGVAVSVQPAWIPGDHWRGGQYVYLLDPVSGMVAYFAHLSEVWVKAGQRVEAGEAVGEVGRTGKNAWAARSDTHLHLMVMRFTEGGQFKLVDPRPSLHAAFTKPVKWPDGGPPKPGPLARAGKSRRQG